MINRRILSVETIPSAYTHARTHAHIHSHTQAPAHTSIPTMQNLIYTQLKRTPNRDLRQRKTTAWNGKHGRAIVLEKEMSWGLIWRSPERVSVGEEGDGLKTEKARGNQQWRVWCEESGGWECQKQSGEYGRCVKSNSHRDKSEQCA